MTPAPVFQRKRNMYAQATNSERLGLVKDNNNFRPLPKRD